MKPIDNRQNKLIQSKAEMKHFVAGHGHTQPLTGEEASIPALHGGTVYGLVSNLLFASKIAQSAKHSHLSIHNFDKAAPLLEHAKKRRPSLVVIDWDGCEAEGFNLLKQFRENVDLKGVPVVGYVSHTKTALKDEAQRAGCQRVYAKSEFTRILDDLLARYS